MRAYKCLTQQVYKNDEFSIIPLRDEDKYAIMHWRNEQVYHLRQNKEITKEEQEHYFTTVVDKLFNQENPSQILFSYLKNNVCIGYGGLVHINWIDNNAEISFLLNTIFVQDLNCHDFYFQIYLSLIQQVTFLDLKLNKLFTETYDVRTHHVKVLEKNGFQLEGRLREQIFINNNYVDSLLHGKLKNEYLN